MSEEPQTTSTPKVMAILPALLPSAMIYIVKPLTVLDQRGLIRFTLVTEDQAQYKDIADYDLVVFSRNVNEKFDYLLQEVVGHRIPYFYDLDDNFWELPLDSWVGRHHRAPFRIAQVEKYLQRATLVRVFNPIIEEKVKESFNENVFHATAGIDTSLVSQVKPERNNDKLKITYVTGRGKNDPLYSVFLNELKGILLKYSEQVEAVFFDGVPDELAGFQNVSETPIIYDYDTFIRTLASSGYDIGLGPLLPEPLYLSKTNTKFRDYGLCRIAGIYSSVDVYTNCVEHEKTGLLVGEVQGAWFEAIERLILNRTLREKIQENAYAEIVRNYNQEIMENEWLELIGKYTNHPRNWLVKPIEPGNETTHISPNNTQKLVLGDNTEKFGDAVRIGSQRTTPENVALTNDGSLPFEDNSFQTIICYYFLESVSDLDQTIREIYRVSKPGAHVFVLSSYSNQILNQANSNYKNPINEHTFRYWTRAQNSPIPYEEYSNGLESWGLKKSDSDPIDLRPLVIEFFYTSPYSDLPIVEKRAARKKFFDVCDLIAGQFVIIKDEGDVIMTNDNNEILMDLPELVEQRYRSRIESLRNELNHSEDNTNTLQAQVDQLLQERERYKKSFEEQRATIESLTTNSEKIENSNLPSTELNSIHVEDRKPDINNTEHATSVEDPFILGDLVPEQKEIDNTSEELEFNKFELSKTNMRLIKVKDKLDETARYFGNTIRNIPYRLAKAFIQETITNNPQMFDDSALHQDLKGYYLQLSPNLVNAPFIPYELKFSRTGLRKINLAFYSPLPILQGELGVEIVEDKFAIIRDVSVPAEQINNGKPISFTIEPLKNPQGKTYEIRVYSRGNALPIFLVEWEWPYLSRRVIATRWRRIFAAFEFTQSS